MSSPKKVTFEETAHPDDDSQEFVQAFTVMPTASDGRIITALSEDEDGEGIVIEKPAEIIRYDDMCITPADLEKVEKPELPRLPYADLDELEEMRPVKRKLDLRTKAGIKWKKEQKVTEKNWMSLKQNLELILWIGLIWFDFGDVHL